MSPPDESHYTVDHTGYMAALIADAPTPDDPWVDRALTNTAKRNGHQPVVQITGEHEQEPSTWTFVDLEPALNGERVQIEPTVLQRLDLRGLMYAGRINGIHADSGVGKGWVQAIATVQWVQDGGHAVWIDFEDPNEELLIDRCRSLGLDDHQILDQVHYINPQGPATDSEILTLIDLMLELGPCLVTVDSTGEALGLQGLDENKDLDVDTWKRLVVTRVERAGHTTTLIDHSNKAATNDLFPSGSKRKRALISGSSWLLETITPFDRSHPGKVKLICAKDRHGAYRRGDVGAIIHFDPSGPNGGMNIAVEAPSEPRERKQREGTINPVIVKRVVAVVKAGGTEGCTLRQLRLAIRTKTKASNGVIEDGLGIALEEGWISEGSGPRNARQFHWTKTPSNDEIEDLFNDD